MTMLQRVCCQLYWQCVAIVLAKLWALISLSVPIYILYNRSLVPLLPKVCVTYSRCCYGNFKKQCAASRYNFFFV